VAVTGTHPHYVQIGATLHNKYAELTALAPPGDFIRLIIGQILQPASRAKSPL
jgi:hypothetical protein